jgi:hypothetical protein
MRLKICHLILLFCLTSTSTPTWAAEGSEVRGAWRPELYEMKDGTQHDVTGLIMFAETDWSVLFFIMDKGEPTRGSGEGGTYSLVGDTLTFRHLYNFSAGNTISGVPGPPSNLTMTSRNSDAPDVPSEPCTIDITGNTLTINFPSGNMMKFVRSSAP